MDGSHRIDQFSKKQNRESAKNSVIIIATFCCSGCMSYLASKIFTDAVGCFMLGICWICIASSFVLLKTYSLRCSKNSKIMIIVGYVLRLILAFWGTYGTGATINFLNSGDQIGFLDMARRYCNGDFTGYYTEYPYVLFWIFTVTGYNRIMPQLVNILCWYFGIIILEKIGSGLYGRKEKILLCAYTFMPWPLLISTQLYREPLMNLLMMLVYYYLWKWMNTGQFAQILYSLLLFVPLFLLHSGNIVMLPVLFIAYVQWDCERQRWRRVSRKCILYVAGILLVPIFLVVIIPRYAGGYLPTSLSLQSLTNYAYNPGRTDYIPEGINVETLPQLAFWTLYRMLYFWISPSPRFWSSKLDLICFLVDVIPWLVLVTWIFGINQRKKSHQVITGIFFILLYTFVYGWATRNAGTAMRHRGQMIGIGIMTILIGIQGKRKGECSENSIFNRKFV